MKWSDVSDLKWKDLKKAAKGLDRDEVLHRLGLEEHTPTSDFFTGLGLFAVGVLVGAGLGVMFAPKPGAEMRNQLGETIRSRRQGQGNADELGATSSSAGLGTSPTITSSRIS